MQPYRHYFLGSSNSLSNMYKNLSAPMKRQRSMIRALVVIFAIIPTVFCQLCETVDSWKSLTDVLDRSYGFAILCPFKISGKACPTENKSYNVKEAEMYAMCDSVSMSSVESECVIDCPGTHFTVFPGTSLTLDGMTLMGSQNSAVRVKSQGYLTSYNSVFARNHRESGNGGAIDAAEGSNLSLMYSRFEDCEAANGGAIYHLGAAVISGSSFIDNRATNGGGGAIFSGSRATTDLTENLFAGNRATFFAPALFDGSDAHSHQERNSACDNVIDGGNARCDGIFSISNGVGSCEQFDDECIPPTAAPTTATPSELPSFSPSTVPSAQPSYEPTRVPTTPPTMAPTKQPSRSPSFRPSFKPSDSFVPSAAPSTKPSMIPSSVPTEAPRVSSSPSWVPSTAPSIQQEPSSFPSIMPSVGPSEQPSLSSVPSSSPTMAPSNMPSATLSDAPSSAPSEEPSTSLEPSDAPSYSPSMVPTKMPSDEPSVSPSSSPTVSPSDSPSTSPSSMPSFRPSFSPSIAPTPRPTMAPTPMPTPSPTRRPTPFTISNDVPTGSGTYSYSYRGTRRRRSPR